MSCRTVGIVQPLPTLQVMLRSFIISLVGALLFSLSMRLFSHGRDRETDPSGRPILRYLAAPYMMSACAATFIAVSAYQWLDPFNHQHSGNLFWLSYLPATIGILAIGCSLYHLSFRATLTRNAIEVYSWPFGHKTYRLSDLCKIDETGRNVVVHFMDNKCFKIYHTYSGRNHFIKELIANSSLDSTAFSDSTRRAH